MQQERGYCNTLTVVYCWSISWGGLKPGPTFISCTQLSLWYEFSFCLYVSGDLSTTSSNYDTSLYIKDV